MWGVTGDCLKDLYITAAFVVVLFVFGVCVCVCLGFDVLGAAIEVISDM